MTLGLRITATLVLGLTAVAGQAEAKEFVYGSWVSAKHGVNVDGLDPLFKEIEKDTKGEVKWRLLAGAQVVSARSTLPGIRDRIVDAGMIVPVFTRKELAVSNVIFDMQMHGQDAVAVAGAATETVMLNCPECLDEYRRFKAVFLSGYGTTPYKLVCAPQITRLADVQKRKVRGVGAGTRWIEAMGAVPVNIPPNEGVEAMQRGALDCAHAPIAWLKSYGFVDVAKHVIDTPMGSPRAMGMVVMNRDSWNSLSLDEKKIMLRHMPMATARATIAGYVGEDEEARKDGLAKGIQFHKGGKDFEELVAKFRETDRKVIGEDMKKLGVKDPERIMAAFDASLPKWEKHAAEIKNDVAKFAAALKREIYDKVDPGKL